MLREIDMYPNAGDGTQTLGFHPPQPPILPPWKPQGPHSLGICLAPSGMGLHGLSGS